MDKRKKEPESYVTYGTPLDPIDEGVYAIFHCDSGSTLGNVCFTLKVFCFFNLQMI